MYAILQTWLKKHLETPEHITLWLFLGGIIAIFGWLSHLLAPVLVAIVIAYLLQWPLSFLQRLRIPRTLAVLIVYTSFIGLIVVLCGLVIPLLIKQLQHLIIELPNMATRGQKLLLYLSERYPHYISLEQIQGLLTEILLAFTHLGQWVLSASLNSIFNIVALSIYLVLIPLLVYFFLIDQKKILNWFVAYLPKHHTLIQKVWTEVYTQTGNYVRGKALEIITVWIVTAFVFSGMGLSYAGLLSFLVGLSSIIPYIGTIVVTVPVTTIAFLQWGVSRDFMYLLSAYGLITLLDANVLSPLLLAEAVSLHPVAIMIAVLVFGGLLGIWGIFFAIPLAVVVKALLNTLKNN
jgi:putative permease